MGKTETGQCLRLSIFNLAKHEYFRGCRSYRETMLSWTNSFTGEESSIGAGISMITGNEFVILYYTATLENGERRKVESKFPLATTFCTFGGRRYWFACSHRKDGKPCGRRVGVLYMKGYEFACRHCHNLTYESRKLSGRYKVAGDIISLPDLQRVEDAVKRKYYNGRITRKYERYLRMNAKARHVLAMRLCVALEMSEERESRKLRRAGTRHNA